MPQYKLGLLPDRADDRDFKLKVPFYKKIILPKSVDLRPGMPPVYNQGELGSCTAQAVAACMVYNKFKQGSKIPFIPSKLYIYYNTRVLENTVNEDSGASLRNAIKAVVNDGMCREQEWPYNIEKFRDKPSDNCYFMGEKHQALKYERVHIDVRSMKAVLADGFPFVGGILIYDSFMLDSTASSGIVPVPNTKTEQVHGGHAVVFCGYDDARNSFLVRNSWGPEWGIKGYCWLPYKFVNFNLILDCWTIKQVE